MRAVRHCLGSGAVGGLLLLGIHGDEVSAAVVVEVAEDLEEVFVEEPGQIFWIRCRA